MKQVSIPQLSLLALTLAVGCGGGGRDPHVLEEKYVHQYGIQVDKTDFTRRGETGKVIARLEGGITVTKTMKKGVLDGDVSYTFPYSTGIEKIETYDEGTLVKETYFDQENYPRKEVAYRPDGTHAVTSWWISGAPKFREVYKSEYLVSGEYYNFEGRAESQVAEGSGMRLLYDDAGLLATTDMIEDGKVILETLYYPNGNPKEVIPHMYGTAEGVKKTFLEGGEPASVEEWVSGCQHGLTVTYRTGEKFAEIPYVKGKKHGIERRYRAGDVLIEEITWREGKMHGPSHSYIGGTVKTDWYLNGKKVTKSFFDHNRKI